MEPLPPVDLIGISSEVLGYRPINGTTGLVQKRLNEIGQGRLLSIDSAKVALRLSQWSDESEKSRIESVFAYGLCEMQNYNTSVLASQLGIQGCAISNLEEGFKNRTILPETRTDLTLLTNQPLMIEKPGYPGVQIDMRDVAANVILTAQSSSDRWKQLARGILDRTLLKEVQIVYSAALRATMYFQLPTSFIEGIVHCCVISSSLTAQSIPLYQPVITSHVRNALSYRLNEVKKGQSKDIEELVKSAVRVGWTPPGLTPENARLMYLGEENPSASISQETDEVDNHTTPTSLLKKRGPAGGRKTTTLRKFEAPTKRAFYASENGATSDNGELGDNIEPSRSTTMARKFRDPSMKVFNSREDGSLNEYPYRSDDVQATSPSSMQFPHNPSRGLPTTPRSSTSTSFHEMRKMKVDISNGVATDPSVNEYEPSHRMHDLDHRYYDCDFSSSGVEVPKNFY